MPHQNCLIEKTLTISCTNKESHMVQKLDIHLSLILIWRDFRNFDYYCGGSSFLPHCNLFLATVPWTIQK